MTRTTTTLSILLAVIAGAGCADKSTNVPPQNAHTIDDINYVHGQYFFFERPAAQLASDARIDFSTLQVFVDDRNGTNDQNARYGYAEIDPTQAAGASPRLVGAFTKLARKCWRSPSKRSCPEARGAPWVRCLPAWPGATRCASA